MKGLSVGANATYPGKGVGGLVEEVVGCVWLTDLVFWRFAF